MRASVVMLIERHKADALLVEEEFDIASGATAVLGENKIGDVLAFGLWIVIIFAI